jgi:hypothetical protein
MSRTAGLGSGDYVAINPVAVTSLVFGIAGALVVVDSLFVVVPVVGLMLGMIAWRQVRQSNRTQTGGLMAGLAILLSLGFLGAKVGKEGLQSVRLGADKSQINHLIDQLSQNLSDIDPAKPEATVAHLASAYDLFDESFRSRVTAQHFNALWLQSRASPVFGPLISLKSNGLLKFETDARTDDLTCTSLVIAQFQRGDAPRWAMVFRQLDGKWLVDDMPELFPTAPAQQRR